MATSKLIVSSSCNSCQESWVVCELLLIWQAISFSLSIGISIVSGFTYNHEKEKAQNFTKRVAIYNFKYILFINISIMLNDFVKIFCFYWKRQITTTVCLSTIWHRIFVQKAGRLFYFISKFLSGSLMKILPLGSYFNFQFSNFK